MQILFAILIPPLADLWESLGPLIFLLLYGIFQVIAGQAEAKKKKPRKPKAPQPVDGPAAPANQPPNQADALRREVEEFLRRAQGEKPEQGEEEYISLSSTDTTKQQTASSQKSKSTRRSRQREPLQQQQPQREMRREGVAEHVARHVQTSQIASHAESLGSKVKQADDRLDSHIHEKFDHQLGSLEKRDNIVTVSSEKKDIAAEIAQLLSQPEGMRQMIIAQEILRRPDHW